MARIRNVVLVRGCSEGGIGFWLCNEYAAKGGQVYATARRTEAMAGLTDANIERLRMDAIGVDMGVHFSVPLTTLYTDYEGMITGDFDTARWQRRRARRT
ncbi:hypothetical protein VTO73DRAFT_273 [Trametes versicolor]